MSLEVRTVTEAEFPDWHRALNTGFLRPPVSADDVVASRRATADLTRTLGAFDEGRCVATFRSFPQELTVVGGATLTADAISNVTVSPTHRRRGLLGRMMGADLAAAKERGDAVATLIAAEYPIYGRFGFGPATWITEWAIDVARTGLDPRRSGPDDGGRIDLVDLADVRKIGPELHDRFRVTQPGAIDRDERWWRRETGLDAWVVPQAESFYAVYRSAAGEVEGLVSYSADGTWGDAKTPECTASVRSLIALTPAAERALWQFVCSIDWVATVRTGHRGPDDLVTRFLPDPRAARVVTHADFLWVRILDVVRALEARTYAAPGTLVLEVVDPTNLAAGRFRLDASPTGAVCARTTSSPDVVLDVRELGALYLGDESAVTLAALGALTEVTRGGAARADVLFHTARRPWCPDIF
ncbi:GNAT family N-acetyltransferase [Streptomyces sp. SID3212]|uniref:GNAT family N-acetyltransferase n=1 Tax=Streptomyces sp. SID3212 TaxID=2690259 RepID=UPI00136F9953|nr:GNAT family N-acetyltransferase [Streptomyces sp. SID3212]MYV51265.1 GNAT family N-acetyltransferase [Streptomyces sp. SID3212]